MDGDSPVAVLKNQILKYQFPSAFSISCGVEVAPRFKIRPFRFLLRMLMDKEVDGLSEEEIAKIVITNAENETEACYKSVTIITKTKTEGCYKLELDWEEFNSARSIEECSFVLEKLNDILFYIKYTIII